MDHENGMMHIVHGVIMDYGIKGLFYISDQRLDVHNNEKIA